MKKGVAVLGLLLVASAAVLYFFVFNKNKDEKTGNTGEQKAAAAVVSKHSEAFNQSVENFMNAYYTMIEGFVNWDTAIVRKESASFKVALDSFKVDELKTDSLIYTDAKRIWNAVKAETAAIVEDNELSEQRGSLNILSQALYDLLNKVQYDKAKVYYQECPMAFNDVEKGNWLSPKSAIRNPYLGTSHPKYHSGMLKCGGTKDSVNFRTASN
jgi:predicted oxidoreductase (fatty acid repression mutant protein)